jgi:hypothetical protein
MSIHLLSASVVLLALGVFLALDGMVLVSGVSGIMFCASVLAESLSNPDPHW